MARRELPEINAGSMADIAFLLLIFFLVTTTMNVDSGISRKLPEPQAADYVPPVIKQKNVFDIVVNRNNQLLIEGTDFIKVRELKELVIAFIDNGGGTGNPMDGQPAAECDWCNGAKDEASSDHPNKAIIQLQSDRGTSYGMYISVQNEIEAAYVALRNTYCLKKYRTSYTQLQKDMKDAQGKAAKAAIKVKIDNAKKHYPQIIAEPEPIK
ncbi:MAG: biopolymer transporter ExbD [Flavobacteriaceae bacterium]|nr:MAG: biopolymer transporter ExbD [Flavobacteriaceae bacterium]